MSKKAAARTPVERYRERMRKAGLRLVQLWIPDSNLPGFAAECQRQSRLASRKKRGERDVMEWIDHNQDTEGWTA